MTTDYKLHLAPIKELPEWVLDIGTGTGKLVQLLQLFGPLLD